MKKRVIAVVLCMGLITVAIAGCKKGDNTDVEDPGVPVTEDAITGLSQIDMGAWQYEEDADTYYQVGLSYCETPADESYETMGVYVPGAYFTAADNGDGTYACEINPDGKAGDYTAETAPTVMPVDTPGYSAMDAPTGYTDVSQYMEAGFIYLYAGCRGRDAGAPSGVADLKAAIRYYRYNDDILPGDGERLFTFGMSGGGAQSALLGTTGDAVDYDTYLDAIGAVKGVNEAVNGMSDAVYGSMCWCPITNLDVADAAYEWNMGSARSDLDDDTQALSDGLQAEFASYINELKLTDADGNVLTLAESSDGIYKSGSYYDYIKDVIETSLEHFLSDTEFPYDASSASQGGGRGGMGGPGGGDFGGQKPDGVQPPQDFGGTDDMEGDAPEEGLDFADFSKGTDVSEGDILDSSKGTDDGQTDKAMGMGGGPGGDYDADEDYTAIDDINRNDTSGGLSLTGTYETAADYIAALDSESQWVTYDESTGEVTITSVDDFAKYMKQPSKDVGAFDALDRSQGENTLFGIGDGSGLHFDEIEAKLLEGTDYEADFTDDLGTTDALGTGMDVRVNMYNPMYYLCEYYGGGAGAAEGSSNHSNVASHFRIRTGLSQGDTAVCTEANLALALAAYGADVDFETIWGAGHTQAERTGDSDTNFIEWVNECMK